MATYVEKPETESYRNVQDRVSNQANEILLDVNGEVRHEVEHIMYAAQEPIDPTQSDHAVQRRAAGLSITFFIAIALFLPAVIAGIAIETHGHY
jgi:hypothetical protein